MLKATSDPLAPEVGARSVFYRNYLLILLMLIQAHNYADRQALGLVLQDIKVDLHLSDTQLGLLTGIAFALFYAVMGIPIARWADRGNRIAIISLSVSLWSIMVALCSRVTSFTQLMILRAGIGVGEAGCFPPTQSLIPDHFTRPERARATSIVMLGGPLSTVLGLFVAGWLNELYGWRTMFVVLGLPGLALALLAWLTLKEPRLEAQADTATHESITQPTLREVIRTLWSNRSFRYLLCYSSILYFLNYGIAQFQPAFLMRSFGMKTGELGTWSVVVFGLSSLIGTYGGGRLASAFAANNERLQLKVAAASYCLYSFAAVFIYLSTNRYVTFILLGLATMVANVFTAPLFSILQTLVPPRMRALAVASIFLFTNFVGIGLGPLALGVLSDVLHSWVGDESLRYALLTACPGYLLGAWFLWRARQTITHDLQVAQARDAGSVQSVLD